jgi:hypothetical protein
MQIIKYTLIIILTCMISVQLVGQDDHDLLTELGQTPFTFRNTKASLGFHLNGNIANDDNNSIFNYFTGDLPEDFEIRFDSTQGLPNLSAGLSLDIFSPNANIGFILGAEYSRTIFQLIQNQNSINYFRIQKINFPAYLKWKFGGVHSQGNAFIAAGAIIGIPLSYSKTNNLVEINDNEFLNNTLSLSSLLGYQLRFANNEKITSNAGSQGYNRAYSRIWFFLRADLLVNNIFDTEVNDKILPSIENSEINYKDLSFTIGVAIFLGSK